MLPLVKFNQPSGTSGVEVTQLLKTTKACSFFRYERFPRMFFSAVLPLDKFNQPSGTSGVEVTQLLKTTKDCSLNPNATCFFFKLECLCFFVLSSICLFLLA